MSTSLAERIHLIQGDITRLNVDAIVNAANESLLGGGGVDGAIHRAAGPELLEECRTLGGCPTGEVRMTQGYNLAARFVLHAVGPVYRGGSQGESALLESCYRNALRLADERKLRSVAFPCISTGIFGYPKAEACNLAVATVLEWLMHHELPREVTFCCFEREDVRLYQLRVAQIEQAG
jgi:O-acetyl-ADP-ribose deacetylase (regulator of RNase III)